VQCPTIAHLGKGSLLYGIVSRMIGAALLLAGGLKAAALATDVPRVDSETWAFRAILIALEIGLGVWLSIGISPRQTHLIAIGCFICFAGVSLNRALAGELSCGCFGRIAIRPLWTFVFDVLAVLGLWTGLPSAEKSRRQLQHWPRLYVAVALCVPALVLTGLAGLRLLHPAPVLSCTESVDLGNVSRGMRQSKSFLLTNTSASQIHIASVRTTCPCLEIILPHSTMMPFETMEACAVLDLREEPEFAGMLSIPVHGITDAGNTAFSLHVKSTVRQY